MFRGISIGICALALMFLGGQSAQAATQELDLLPANCFYATSQMNVIDCFGVVTAQTPGIPGGYVCYSRANVFSVCSIP